MRHAREATAEHDDVGVKQVDNGGQRARQPLRVALKRGQAGRVAGQGGGVDLLGGELAARHTRVVARQARAAEPGLNTVL